MRDCCLGVLMALILVGAVQPCLAEEFSGKLERVDLETVTIVGSNNQKFVLQVNHDNRKQAALFLGKRVRVDFQSDKGQPPVAIRFRPCQ
jgi:hypothetical protein